AGVWGWTEWGRVWWGGGRAGAPGRGGREPAAARPARAGRPRRVQARRCRSSRRQPPRVLGSSGRGAGRLELLVFPLEALELFLEGDHLQLAADHDLLELLEVEDLLLQVGLRPLEIAHDLLISAHISEDADGADYFPVRVPEGRGVQRCRDDLPRGAAWIQARVSGDAVFDDLAEGSRELARLLGADEAGERLLDHLVLAEGGQARTGLVRLDDLPLQV